jgi:HTH-type transcriptional regulator / antitoxin HipB
MDFALKTLGQIRPVLMGFRKGAGLTQAAMARRLGITQQSYAAFEANPGVARVNRLFQVLRILHVELALTAASDEAGRKGGASGEAKGKAGDAAASRVTASRKVPKPSAATARPAAGKPTETGDARASSPRPTKRATKAAKATKATKPVRPELTQQVSKLEQVTQMKSKKPATSAQTSKRAKPATQTKPRSIASRAGKKPEIW